MSKSKALLALCAESCDLKLRKVLKDKSALQAVISKVYNAAQAGDVPWDWHVLRGGGAVPSTRMAVRSVAVDPKQQVCVCGKKLEYVFEVTLPMWFVNAVGLDSDVHLLGQECVRALDHGHLTSGNLSDWLKREIKFLKRQKKHGAL